MCHAVAFVFFVCFLVVVSGCVGVVVGWMLLGVAVCQLPIKEALTGADACSLEKVAQGQKAGIGQRCCLDSGRTQRRKGDGPGGKPVKGFGAATPSKGDSAWRAGTAAVVEARSTV